MDYKKLLNENKREVLYCDSCGKEIKGFDGMMVWNYNFDKREVDIVKYGHYGDCNYDIGDKFPDGDMTANLDWQLDNPSMFERFLDYLSDKKLTNDAIEGLSRIYGSEIMNIILKNNMKL